MSFFMKSSKNIKISLQKTYKDSRIVKVKKFTNTPVKVVKILESNKKFYRTTIKTNKLSDKETNHLRMLVILFPVLFNTRRPVPFKNGTLKNIKDILSFKEIRFDELRLDFIFENWIRSPLYNYSILQNKYKYGIIGLSNEAVTEEDKKNAILALKNHIWSNRSFRKI